MSSWADPPPFLLESVLERVIQEAVETNLRWGTVVASLRLVCRSWRAAASRSVRALAFRRGEDFYGSFLDELPAVCPQLEVLQLAGLGVGGPAGFWPADLRSSLRSLRLLGTHRAGGPFSDPYSSCVDPPQAGWSVLGQLQRLVAFELQGCWQGCCDAAASLAACSQLRGVTLAPVPQPNRRANFDRQPRVMLALCLQLTRLRSLTCATDNASLADVAALSSLQHLSALGLLGLPAHTIPVLAQLADSLSQLRRLSVAENGYMMTDPVIC